MALNRKKMTGLTGQGILEAHPLIIQDRQLIIQDEEVGKHNLGKFLPLQ